MVKDVGEFKPLRLLIFEELQCHMLSGYIGIVDVMRFDEGFPCPPDGRLVVDCVDS